MSKKATDDLSALIAKRIEDTKPGFRSWFHRLPDDARRQLAKVRSDYHAGAVVGQKRAIAKAIMEVAAEQGWKTSGITGVIAWLNEKA